MHSKEKLQKIRERAEVRKIIYNHAKEFLSTSQNRVIKEGADEFFNSTFAKMFGLNSLRNAAQMAVRGVKNTLTTIGGETRVVLKSLAAVIIPGITSDKTLSEMAREERQKIKNKIEETDREYADVINRIDATFKAVSDDTNMMLFLANPGAYIGANITVEAASVAWDAITSLLPESDKEKERREEEAWARKLRSALGVPTPAELQQQQQQQQAAAEEAARRGAAEEAARHQAAMRELQRKSDAELERAAAAALGRAESRAGAGPAMGGSTSLREQYQQQQQAARPQQNAQAPASTQQQPVFDINKLTPQKKAELKKLFDERDQRRINVLKDPKTSQAINSTPRVQNGQKILVQTLSDESKKKISSVKWEDIKNKIDWNTYFKQNNIMDKKEQEKQKNMITNGVDAESKKIQQQLVSFVKDAYKKEAQNKLNTIKTQNNPPPTPDLVALIDTQLKDFERLAPTPQAS